MNLIYLKHLGIDYYTPRSNETIDKLVDVESAIQASTTQEESVKPIEKSGECEISFAYQCRIVGAWLFLAPDVLSKAEDSLLRNIAIAVVSDEDILNSILRFPLVGENTEQQAQDRCQAFLAGCKDKNVQHICVFGTLNAFIKERASDFTLVQAPTLEKMLGNVELKKQAWQLLKPLVT